jgi:hypothetical protein
MPTLRCKGTRLAKQLVETPAALQDIKLGGLVGVLFPRFLRLLSILILHQHTLEVFLDRCWMHDAPQCSWCNAYRVEWAHNQRPVPRFNGAAIAVVLSRAVQPLNYRVMIDCHAYRPSGCDNDASAALLPRCTWRVLASRPRGVHRDGNAPIASNAAMQPLMRTCCLFSKSKARNGLEKLVDGLSDSDRKSVSHSRCIGGPSLMLPAPLFFASHGGLVVEVCRNRAFASKHLIEKLFCACICNTSVTERKATHNAGRHSESVAQQGGSSCPCSEQRLP